MYISPSPLTFKKDVYNTAIHMNVCASHPWPTTAWSCACTRPFMTVATPQKEIDALLLMWHDGASTSSAHFHLHSDTINLDMDHYGPMIRGLHSTSSNVEIVMHYCHKQGHACHKLKVTQTGTPRIGSMSSQMHQVVEPKDSDQEPEPVLTSSSIVSNAVVMMTGGASKLL